MIIFLTYNDHPNGVYWSQVTDVVAHLNRIGNEEVRLVALVSLRSFWRWRRMIKAHSPHAVVVPMVPQMKRWRRNSFTLWSICLWLRPRGIIARGPFATWMAQRMRERGMARSVCFDGRGAYAAEWEEYRIVNNDALIAQVPILENVAVNKSDFRIGVSNALIDHWRDRYGYVGDAHAVIPCTLGHSHLAHAPMDAARRAALGYTEEDVVLVYSGSTAKWQSFALLENFLEGILAAQPKVKVLFLSKPDPRVSVLVLMFPGRVRSEWCIPQQVPTMLALCDHGIMVRENSVTNRVASPTKFAEYLCAGLKVIVPEYLGDFSTLTKAEGLGIVHVPGEEPPVFERPSAEFRAMARSFALEHLQKTSYDKEYNEVLAHVGHHA